MVDMTLLRPLNKGQGYSFWYQSVDFSHMAVNSNFCYRKHRLAKYIPYTQDDDRQTERCVNRYYGQLQEKHHWEHVTENLVSMANKLHCWVLLVSWAKCTKWITVLTKK